MPREFPRLANAIEQGAARHLHTGVQVYVSVGGEVVLNAGFGEAGPGRPLDEAAIMLWRSAGKPVTAAAILSLVEQAALRLDSTVRDCLPQAGGDVGSITIAELLTHTSGLPLLDTGWPALSWEDTLQRILTAGPRDRAVAAYQPQSTWFMLGEILRRHTDPADTSASANPIDAALRRRLFSVVGMDEVWCGLPDHLVSSPRLPCYYERQRGQLTDSDYGTAAWLKAPSPGGNLRGPVRVLGEFYEMLMRGGVAADGTRVLQQSTVNGMVRRHRMDRYDETLQHVIDFGLGIIVNSNHHGVDTVPYGFSRYSSPDSFGHGGAQCSIGFCDPQRQLVVAWAANAFCGEGQHQRRNRAINEAIYEDLGFVASATSA